MVIHSHSSRAGSHQEPEDRRKKRKGHPETHSAAPQEPDQLTVDAQSHSVSQIKPKQRSRRPKRPRLGHDLSHSYQDGPPRSRLAISPDCRGFPEEKASKPPAQAR